MIYQAIEDAIRAWLVNTSGLEEDKIYFAHEEGVASPPRPCIVIDVQGNTPRGIDALTHKYDGTAPNGQEITTSTLGWRELLVSLQAFGSRTTEPNPGDEATARQLLDQVRDALFLPGVRGALNAASLGVKDAGTVRWLPGIQNAKWEGRAVLDCTFNVLSTVTEKTGYIARVKVTGRVSDPPPADPNVNLDVVPS